MSSIPDCPGSAAAAGRGRWDGGNSSICLVDIAGPSSYNIRVDGDESPGDMTP